MEFSLITPSHNVVWLEKALPSVLAQTFKDFEWVILLNNQNFTAEQVHVRLGGDPRIRVFKQSGNSKSVGFLKNAACAHARGNYVVEFDHDDELSVDCLSELYDAFQTHAADFVFSDYWATTSEGHDYTFGEAYGWTYRHQAYHGHDGDREVLVADHPADFPQHFAQIYYAPNHVRAWRRQLYADIGGHDANLSVCDDLDLICRLYLRGKVVHVPKPLYKYLVHGKNTWLGNQAEIASKNLEIYDRYIEPMAVKAAKARGLAAYDLGGGINPREGFESVDMHHADIVADLNETWPFPDDSVGVLRAQDLIEHLKDPIHVMNEAHRVLAHGGLFLIEVPSTDGRGAFQDPTHVSFWNRNSFFYYTTSTQRFIKHTGVNCRFQQVRIADYLPSKWHELHKIWYTKSHLAALKSGPRLHGLLEI